MERYQNRMRPRAMVEIRSQYTRHILCVPQHDSNSGICWIGIYNMMVTKSSKRYSLTSSRGLTHWGRVTHICVGNLTIIGSDIGLSPGRHQAIIRTNAEILSIGPLETNFSKILIEIHISIQENANENVICQIVAILSRPQCVKYNHDGSSTNNRDE